MKPAFSISMAALSLVMLVLAVRFVVDPGAPFGFYSDLGSDAMTSAYIMQSVHGVGDLRDLWSWFAWYDEPSFSGSAELSYLLSAPLVLATGSMWTATKIVIALQFAVAAAGGAFYAKSLRRVSTAWAVASGWVYALVPQTALAIRGDAEIGWIVALLPWMLVASISLSARYRSWALPAIAVLADLAGFAFHVEYGILVSVPLYSIFLLDAVRRYGARATLPVLAGVFVFATVPCFLVLSTVASKGLFTDPPARSAELSTGAVLDTFSQNAVAFAALMQRENLLSPRDELNSTAQLPAYAVVAVPLGLIGIIWFVRIGRRQSVNASSAIVGGVCAILSLGTLWPGGQVLWHFIAAVPIIDALRTPDRFATLPIALLTLWGMAGIAAVAQVRLRPAAIVASIGVCAALALLVLTDLQSGVLVTEAVAEHEPDLDATRDLVRTAGGRTFSVAFARAGSIFDFPAYGAPQPSFGVGWDIVSRYFARAEGAAILARSGVRTIVSSPVWLTEGGTTVATLPESLARDGELRVRSHLASGIIVYDTTEPAGDVTARRRTCFLGGPGLLDVALGDAPQDAFTMSRDRGCARSVLANYSPIDSIAASALAPANDAGAAAIVRGHDLFPASGSAESEDPEIIVTSRRFLNDSWYRDTLDGDRFFFTTGRAPLVTSAAASVTPVAIAKTGPMLLAIHFAPQSDGVFSVTVDGHARSSFAFRRAMGLAWATFDLGALAAGPHQVAIGVAPASQHELSVAIDGAMIAPSGAAASAIPVESYYFSSDRIARADETAQDLARSTEIGELSRISTRDVRFGAGQLGDAIFTTGPDARLEYRIAGPSASYDVSADAWLSGQGSSISIGRVHRGIETCCVAFAAYDPSAIAPVSAEGLASFATGDDFVVHVSSPQETRLLSSQIIHVTAERHVAILSSAFDDDGVEHFEVPLFDPAATAAVASSLGGAVLAPSTISGAAGASPLFRFRPTLAPPLSVTLRVETPVGATANGATIELRCGTTGATAPIASSTSLSIRATSRDCSARIRYSGSGARITKVAIDVASDHLDRLATRTWLPAGRFDARLVARTGHRAVPGTVWIDGRPADTRTLTAGMHDLEFRNVTSAPFVLSLRRPAATPVAPVTSRQTSIARWSVATTGAAFVELTQLDDGHWFAESDGARVHGTRCDLLDTCFAIPRAGTYRIGHDPSPALMAGTLVSLLGLAVAGTPLVLLRRRTTSSSSA